jgi:hypothetical protein
MYKSLTTNFDTVSIGLGNNTVTLPGNIMSVAWSSMQFEVACCGVNNYTDYANFNWNRTFTVKSSDGSPMTIQNAVVPPSCCTLNQKNVVPKTTDDFADLPNCLQGGGNYNAVGCYSAVRSLAVTYFYIPIGICIAVIIVEIICMSMAIYLWRTNEKKEIA